MLEVAEITPFLESFGFDTDSGGAVFPGIVVISVLGSTGPTVVLSPGDCPELFTWSGRTRDFALQLYEADSVTGVAIKAGDVVRVKIGRTNGDALLLDIDSLAPTEAGSSIAAIDLTAPAILALRIAQDDTTSLPPGTYAGEITISDSGETLPVGAVKHCQDFILQVLQGLGGNTGL